MFHISKCSPRAEDQTISVRRSPHTKRIIFWSMFLEIILCACSPSVLAQWTQPDASGNINSTNTGNVGIGTNAPAHKLEVSGNINGTNVFSSKRVFRDAINHSGAPAIWYKIATLPVTGNSTGDLLDLRVTGGRYDSINKFGMEVKMGNRNGFSAYVYSAFGQVSERLYSRVMAYNNGGAVEVYLYLPGTYGFASYSSIGVEMTATGWGTGPILYPTSAGVTTAPPGTLVFDSSTASIPLTINNSGSVGVGTTAPAYRLDVQGGSVNAAGGLCINGDCKTAWSQVGSSQWTPSASTIFYNAGNVGIGTSNAPTRRLEVFGGNVFHQWSTAGSEYGFYTSINNNHLTSNLYFDGQWKMITTGKGAFVGSAPSNGWALHVYGDNTSRAANAVSSLLPLLTVTLGGNVGVGTTTPDPLAKLHVSGSGSFGQDIQTTTNDWTRLRLMTPARTWGFFLDGGNGGIGSGKLGLFDYTANLWRMIFDTAGNVGLGTTSPTEKLEVDGNLKLTGTGNITAAGTIEGGVTLRRNIRTSPNGLNLHKRCLSVQWSFSIPPNPIR